MYIVTVASELSGQGKIKVKRRSMPSKRGQRRSALVSINQIIKVKAKSESVNIACPLQCRGQRKSTLKGEVPTFLVRKIKNTPKNQYYSYGSVRDR